MNGRMTVLDRTGSVSRDVRFLFLCVALAATISWPSAGAAQAGGADPVRGRLVSMIEEIAQRAVEQEGVPALGVAVMLGEDVLVAGGFGTANVERHVAATAQTVFRIGSVTKQFAAAAILQLVDEGRLALDDDITKYVPEFTGHGNTITVTQLLNHTSGVKNYTALPSFPQWSRFPATDDEVVARFANEPLDFEPGTSHRYSNSGYYLLGVIVERVSGLEFDDFLRQHLLDPLDLKQTYYCHDADIIPHRAAGYAWREGHLENASVIHMNIPGAAGALCATPLDLVQWTRALHSGRVLSAESFRLMVTPTGAAIRGDQTSSGPTLGYGYGLGVSRFGGHLEIGHGGSINGFLASLSHFPDDDLTIAVLVNATNSLSPDSVAHQIAARILGVPEADLLR